MSVTKFKFVSPGVFINEIDNSQLPREPDKIGPVIIGRTRRGPSIHFPILSRCSEHQSEAGRERMSGEVVITWDQLTQLTLRRHGFATPTQSHSFV